jgi:hypothetical protein
MPSLPTCGAHWTVFAVSAVLSLLLSPITALYAAVIGVLGFLASLIIGRAITRPAMIAGGITVGSLPYIIAGLVI